MAYGCVKIMIFISHILREIKKIIILQFGIFNILYEVSFSRIFRYNLKRTFNGFSIQNSITLIMPKLICFS